MERFEVYFNRLDESSEDLHTDVKKTMNKLKTDLISKLPEKITKIDGKDPKNILTVKYCLIASLYNNGITSNKAIANILAQIVAESGFRAVTENTNWGANFLYNTWGPEQSKNTVRIKNMQHAEQVASLSAEKKAEMMYGKRNGNDKPGDGYKYRGRGFIQLSGKSNYKKIGNILGIDLVNNPEYALDTRYIFDITAAYYKYRAGNDISVLDNIDRVNKITGPATNTEEQRKDNSKKILASLTSENIKQIVANYSDINKYFNTDIKYDKYDDYASYPLYKGNKNLPVDTFKNFDLTNIKISDIKDIDKSNALDIVTKIPMLAIAFQKTSDKKPNTTQTDIVKKDKKPKEQLKDFKDYKSLDDLANDIHKSRLSFYYS